MADWDTGSPGDTDIVSQFPANERAARDAAKTNFGVDHREVDDADVGAHERVTLLEQPAAPTQAANRGFLYTKEVNGETELFWLGSNGDEVRITTEGKIAPEELTLPEVSDTPDAIADTGQLYTKEFDGGTELYWLDADDNEIRLTYKGELVLNLQETDAVFKSMRTTGFSRGNVEELTPTAGVLTIDWQEATVYRLSGFTQDTDIVFENMPDTASGETQTIYLDITGAGTNVLTVTSAFDILFPEGVTPTLTDGGRDLLVATTNEGSSVIVVPILDVRVPA